MGTSCLRDCAQRPPLKDKSEFLLPFPDGPPGGFSADDVIRKLRRAGFVFDRQRRSSHQIWRHPTTKARTTVTRHPGALPEGTVAAIIREAGSPLKNAVGVRVIRPNMMASAVGPEPPPDSHMVPVGVPTLSLPGTSLSSARLRSVSLRC
jgi:predicted RNA binding protein YcfA (HicA-like mRNA interferase family)